MTYTPRGNFLGTDTFRYTISDGSASASGSVTVNVVRFIALPNPSADGNYTVKWAALAGATNYMLIEDGTTPHIGPGRSRSFTGKARGSHVYTLMGCTSGFRGIPNCRTDSGYGSLRVRVGAPLPAAPAPLSAKPNPSVDGSFRVSWPASPGATRYELEESLSGGWSRVHNGTATHKDLSGRSITATTRHRYRARACDGNADTDCGGWSPELEVPVTGTVTATPNPSADGAYTVSWTPSRVAARYKLDESTDGGATWPVSHTVTGTQRAFTGKADGTYTYRVRSCLDLRLPGGGREVCTPLIPTRQDATLDVVVARGLAPPTLTVTPGIALDGSYRVSWGASTGARSYVLQERTDRGAWSNVAGVRGRAKSFSSRGVAVYGYQVKACATSRDCGAWSPAAAVRVPPAAPANLTSTAPDTNRSYTVSWDAATGADRYVLEERTDAGTIWTAVPKQSSDAVTSRAIEKAADGTFHYRVQACQGTGNCGEPSGTHAVTVTTSTVVRPEIGVPGGFAVDAVGRDDYTLKWNAVTGAARYELVRSVNGGNWSKVHDGEDRSKAYEDEAQARYRYRVRACPATGDCGDYTAIVSVSVPIPTPIPQNLQVTDPDAQGRHTVSWDRVSFRSGVLYLVDQVHRNSLARHIVAGASREFPAPTPGDYTYTMKACLGFSHCSDDSASVTVTVPPRQPGPATLPGICRGGAQDVSWPKAAGATLYILQTRPPRGTWDEQYRGSSPRTSLTLTAGSSVEFQVRACEGEVDKDGNGNCGAWSATATLVVPECPQLAVPGGLRIDPTDPDDYTVEWDAVDGAGRYELQESTDGGATWPTNHSVAELEKPFSGKAADTYHYRVRACPDEGDCGDWSQAVSVTVPIAPRQVLTVETPPSPYNAQASLVTDAERKAIDQTGTVPGAFRVTESGRPATACRSTPCPALPG